VEVAAEAGRALGGRVSAGGAGMLRFCTTGRGARFQSRTERLEIW
jgi:hypothetical protein